MTLEEASLIVSVVVVATMDRIASKKDGTSTIGFIDDTTLIAQGKNFAATHDREATLPVGETARSPRMVINA